MSTTRFPAGVTNVGRASTLGYIGMPDPTKYHTYFDDFNTYSSASWTNTTTGSGTVATTSVDGGCILLTTSGTSADNVFLDLLAAGFLMATGAPTWFKCRFKASDVTNSSLVIGLQIIDTTPLDVTDGIYFLSSTGAATVDVICRKDATTGSTSATAIATLVNDTFVTLGWYWDGIDNLAYYVNDVQIGTLTGIAANYLPDAQLTASIGIQTGAAAAKSMTVDYFLASKAR